MRGDDAPAFRHACPRLALATDAVTHALAIELQIRGAKVPAIGGDDNRSCGAGDVARVTCSAEAGDLVIAVEVLADAEAQGQVVGPEQLVKNFDVVGCHRCLISIMGGS